MESSTKILFWLFGIAVVCVFSFFFLTPQGHAIMGDYSATIEKVDDNSSYESKKQVEDTARSMISSYNSDKNTYDQYKSSANSEKQSWAEEAKMRANRTANTYNEYITKNSFIWEQNVPKDIDIKLAIIQ